MTKVPDIRIKDFTFGKPQHITHSTVSFIRSSGCRRLRLSKQSLKCWNVPTLGIVFHPWPARAQVVPQPLPSVWGDAGGLRREGWGWSLLWYLRILGWWQRWLDIALYYEVKSHLCIIYLTQNCTTVFYSTSNHSQCNATSPVWPE